jgi:hypothetical protein
VEGDTLVGHGGNVIHDFWALVWFWCYWSGWCWSLWILWICWWYDLLSADWTALVGNKFFLLIWSTGCAFSLGHFDHSSTVLCLGAFECVAETLVPYCSDSLLLILVHAVWFFANAATAGGILQILVEEFLALFLAVGFGQLADLSALFTAVNAVALHAFTDIPALTIGVGNVSFLACALGAIDAHFTVPYLVERAGAGWYAVGFVADVAVLVAGTFAWAGLEGTASGTDNVWFAVMMVDHLLHAFMCADHVCAVYAWYFNLLRVLVEFAVVVAWAS